MNNFRNTILLTFALIHPINAYAETLYSPKYKGVTTEKLDITGSGSTGNIDNMTVGGSSLGTVLPSKAPLANPVFTGVISTPSINITGSNSTGDASNFVTKALRGSVARTNKDRADDIINVKDFGATCNGSGVGDQAAFTQAITALNTGNANTGGIINIPVGICKFTASLPITTTEVDGVASITLQGGGQHNTILDFSAVPASNDGIVISKVTGIKLRDFKIQGAKRDNIYVFQAKHIEITNVRSQGAVRDGLRVTDAYMIAMKDIWSLLNGGNGFTFGVVGGTGTALGYNTSLSGTNLYAMYNSVDGFRIDNTSYSSFAATGSDHNRYNYNISNVAGVTFTGVGAESGIFGGFYIAASAALAAGATVPDIKGLTLVGAVGVSNSTGAPGGNNFGEILAFNDRPIKVTIIGANDLFPVSGITKSLTVSNPTANVVEINNSFSGTTNYTAGAVQRGTP